MRNEKGIILRSTNYQEADKILTILTFNRGIITVKARGVRKKNAKFAPFSTVLTFAEFSISEGKNGYILSGVDAIENFYNCWDNPLKYSSAMLCVELTERLYNFENDTKYVALELVKALKEINYANTYSFAVALKFFIKCCDISGVDYTEIATQNKETDACIFCLKNREYDEIESMDVTPAIVMDTLRVLTLLVDDKLGVKLKVMEQVIKSL